MMKIRVYNSSMVELKVLTLVVMSPGNPCYMVLEPIEETSAEGKSRVVSICIGTHEAMALGSVLESTRFDRPMTHDLMLDALTNLDARVDHALIRDVKSGTYFATLYLAQHDRIIELDARPSDAIALALRQEAPIFVEEKVLKTASYPYLYRNPLNEDKLVDEFKNFLEKVTPEDFA